MVTFDFAAIPQQDRYRLMIGAIVPRPIAFVSTLSPEGVGNLAPFSFFNGVSSDPPCVVVSITRKSDLSKKDTLRNIEATGEFVINLVSREILEAVNQCSAEYPYGVNEMEKVGLHPAASVKVRPARVSESPVQMECVLEQLVPIGSGGQGSATLVIGRIAMMHVKDEAYRDGKIRFEELHPVSRLGGISYGFTNETVAIPRPKV